MLRTALSGVENIIATEENLDKNNDTLNNLLIDASSLGHSRNVELLLSKGADINAKNSTVLTFLLI